MIGRWASCLLALGAAGCFDFDRITAHQSDAAVADLASLRDQGIADQGPTAADQSVATDLAAADLEVAVGTCPNLTLGSWTQLPYAHAGSTPVGNYHGLVYDGTVYGGTDSGYVVAIAADGSSAIHATITPSGTPPLNKVAALAVNPMVGALAIEASPLAAIWDGETRSEITDGHSAFDTSDKGTDPDAIAADSIGGVWVGFQQHESAVAGGGAYEYHFGGAETTVLPSVPSAINAIIASPEGIVACGTAGNVSFLGNALTPTAVSSDDLPYDCTAIAAATRADGSTRCVIVSKSSDQVCVLDGTGGTWACKSLQGTKVAAPTAVAIDSCNPDAIFVVGTSFSAAVSTDGGASWKSDDLPTEAQDGATAYSGSDLLEVLVVPGRGANGTVYAAGADGVLLARQ